MKVGRSKAMLSAAWVILAVVAVVIAAIVVGSVLPVVTREIRHPRTKLTTTPAAEPRSPGKAAALRAAEQWLESQRIDPKNYTFDARPDGAGWAVMAEYQPPTPGAHTLLRIDTQGNVVGVFPGR